MICAASCGNGAASLALYAAAAGLQCCIVTTSALSPVFRRAIIMTGAQIVTASDSLERWDHNANMVKEQGAFPATNYLDPPDGSNDFGFNGVKTIAYEMFEELETDLVDAVLVSNSLGDLITSLFGVRRGSCRERGCQRV